MSKLDWKSVVRTVAPALGTALASPAAGVAIKILGDTLLGDPEAGESSVSEAVLSGLKPEQIAAIKQQDIDFRKQMLAAGMRIEELDNEDRASAREREIKSGDGKTPKVLAAIVVLGFFTTEVVLISGTSITTENRELVYILIGTLTAAFTQVLNYYLGSSSGSARKDWMWKLK